MEEEEEEEEEKQDILVMNNNKNMLISENHRCWLHLPHEIVELIMKRLFYADLLNFRLVCKSWNSSINRGGVTVPLKQSPWLLMFDRIKFTQQPPPPPRASATYCEMVRNWKKTSKACSCKLFDPVYKKTYTINMTSNININLFLIQHVYASKHGWILVSSSDHFGIGHSSLFFAYTPFSTVNNFIELPALESCHNIQLATFTSNPSSIMAQEEEEEDCLFVVLHNPGWNTDNNYVHRGIIISTCRPGEKSWSRRYLKYSVPVLEFNSYNVSRRERWIYSEGNIYYMIHLGKQLGQPRVVKWELVRVVKWELIMKGRHGHGNHEEEEEEEEEEHHELYGSVMNMELLDHEDDDDDDLLSKLEKDHFSILNYFAQPLRTAGTEYESCHTERNRKMVKIDPPLY